MKLYDLCILKENNSYPDLAGSFAIILEDCIEYYLCEVWNFEKFKGAEVLGVAKKDLIVATKEEEDDFMKKFMEY